MAKVVPLPSFDFNVNRTAVILHNPFSNGKPQAKTGRHGTCARFLGAIEAVKDIGQVFTGDARPGIADDDARLVADTRASP